jgi:glycosyltransferase involved in cell wall biosynthesis
MIERSTTGHTGTREMRIAYIAVKGIPIGGGIEKLTEEIGSRMVARGHDVVVYTSRDYGTVDGIHKGIRIKTVPSINTKSLHKMSICMNAVLDVLRANDVDVVHIHAVGPSLFALLTRLRGIPTVVQTHGLEWKRDKWGGAGRSFFKLADLTAVYFPHATTAVSRVQQRYYEDKFKKPIVYIPTGVNRVVSRKPGWILERGLTPHRYMLFAARLVEEKGAHLLIKAVQSMDTDMKVVIAGDAAHAEGYKSKLRALAAGDSRFVFTGFVNGMPLEELFSNAYLFCLPSTLEGLPIALLEAMSYGNCCVASDIPENREAIKEYGYTFKSRDSEDLKRVLGDLVEHPEKAERMRRIARNYVLENYCWDKIVDQMEALYLSLV